MRRSIAPVCLLFLGTFLVAGCRSPKADIEAGREYVRHWYCAFHITLDFFATEAPEYADIPKIPRDHLAIWAADRSAACGVRVQFIWRTGNSTTQDDWIVWVSSEHKAVGWSGNPRGDDWRQFVKSVAKQ
jgi:hypothetical protein